MNNLRQTLKRMMGSCYRHLPQIGRAVERGLTVFVFHDVSDVPSRFTRDFDISVSTELFERQARWIRANFNVIHPATLVATDQLPARAALITFDDGFLGTFDNGLSILKDLDLPSLIFLNMKAILEGGPTLSALACYLDSEHPQFVEFAQKSGLSRPYHLTLSPSVLGAFESQYGTIDRNAALQYQGPFADLDTLHRWDGDHLVAYGNHFFDHWNAVALSPQELADQFKRNRAALTQFGNTLNLFAFTNGQPETCFTVRDVALLRDLGAGKVFAASCGVNRNAAEFVVGRLSFSQRDDSDGSLWFRVGQAVFDNRLERYRASL